LNAGPETAAYRFRKFVRRHKRLLAASSIIVALSLLGFFGTSIGMARARSAESKAKRAETLQAAVANEALKFGDETGRLTLRMLTIANDLLPYVNRRKDVSISDVNLLDSQISSLQMDLEDKLREIGILQSIMELQSSEKDSSSRKILELKKQLSELDESRALRHFDDN